MTDIEKLNKDHGIAGVAAIAPGEGGLARIHITAAHSAADIYLHGAQITSWIPSGIPSGSPTADPPEQPNGAGNDSENQSNSNFGEVLFLSRFSRWEPGRAIRGGIPVCFPWFRGKADNAQAPAHGFARIRAWNLLSITQAFDAVVVTLQLESDADTRRWWPHEFRATLSITVAAGLTLALAVQNIGSAPMTFEQALHTYFRVGDVHRVRVEGLDGAPYLDNNEGNREKTQQGPLAFNGPTDNAYLGIATPVTLHDPVLGRQLRTVKSGSSSTVAWNPWQQAAAALADLGDDEWQTMSCVEAANILADAVTLAPGETHSMSAALSVASL